MSLKNNLPILGICGGEQLINVSLGGTLIQDIKNLKFKTLEHEQLNPRDQTSHQVYIEPKTLLHSIIGEDTINVNSAHHQAVKNPGKNLTVNAIAEDGLIEGIENNNKKFCLGVQWHPEYSIDSGDKKIFQAFVSACRK